MLVFSCDSMLAVAGLSVEVLLPFWGYSVSPPGFPVICVNGFETLVCDGIDLRGMRLRYYEDKES